MATLCRGEFPLQTGCANEAALCRENAWFEQMSSSLDWHSYICSSHLLNIQEEEMLRRNVSSLFPLCTAVSAKKYLSTWPCCWLTWWWWDAWQGLQLKYCFANYSQRLVEVKPKETAGSKERVKTVVWWIFQQKECISKLILFSPNV